MNDRWTAALILLLTTACRGPAEARERDRRIPYHVAIAPIEAVEDEAASEGDVDFQLRVLPEEVRGRLRDRLEADFSHVSLLEPVEGELTPASLEQMARERGADVILRLRSNLEADRRIEHDRTVGAAALNVLVYIFFGPVSWFTADNEYSVASELNFSLVDLNLLRLAVQGSSSDAYDDSTIFSSSADVDPVTLSFNERTKRWRDRLTSIIVPATFLATDAEGALQRLEEYVGDELIETTAKKLDTRRVILNRHPVRLLDYALDPRADGGWELHLELDVSRLVDPELGLAPGDFQAVFRSAAAITEVRELDPSFVAEDERPVEDSGTFLQRFTFRVPPPPVTDSGVLQVLLEKERGRQSWSFPLNDRSRPIQLHDDADEGSE